MEPSILREYPCPLGETDNHYVFRSVHRDLLKSLSREQGTRHVHYPSQKATETNAVGIFAITVDLDRVYIWGSCPIMACDQKFKCSSEAGVECRCCSCTVRCYESFNVRGVSRLFWAVDEFSYNFKNESDSFPSQFSLVRKYSYRCFAKATRPVDRLRRTPPS